MDLTNKDDCCPLRYALEVMGGRWKLPIMCILAKRESVRYSVIKKKIGEITGVMLSQSLKDMETDGLVTRVQYNEIPPRVEYSLTDKGRSFVPVLQSVCSWSLGEMKEAGITPQLCKFCNS
jgi:DNA-binding HxlR family transcriptional regulator